MQFDSLALPSKPLRFHIPHAKHTRPKKIQEGIHQQRIVAETSTPLKTLDPYTLKPYIANPLNLQTLNPQPLKL